MYKWKKNYQEVKNLCLLTYVNIKHCNRNLTRNNKCLFFLLFTFIFYLYHLQWTRSESTHLRSSIRWRLLRSVNYIWMWLEKAHDFPRRYWPREENISTILLNCKEHMRRARRSTDFMWYVRSCRMQCVSRLWFSMPGNTPRNAMWCSLVLFIILFLYVYCQHILTSIKWLHSLNV